MFFYLKILFQPTVLNGDLMPPEVDVVVEFEIEVDEVNGSHIEAWKEERD